MISNDMYARYLPINTSMVSSGRERIIRPEEGQPYSKTGWSF
jgi:hypothetical protein